MLLQRNVFLRTGRLFSTTACRLSASKPSTTQPYLHFHPLPKDATRPFAVSFLSSKDLPSNSTITDYSNLIIGWSPETIDMKTFVENPGYIDFMTSVLKHNIHKVNDSTLKSLAEWQKEGWLHIADERNPPPWGRIPYPEDIIGTVLVNNGVIQPETYQEMPTHRLVTSNGIFQLSEPLRQCIVDAAKKLVKQ
ncbi:hypothetical protein O0I10_007902 [Lichtheimia ornata]|uniref:Uncharacterized protein n=1 Tax=Lichtheimia ornata TaxID=688661 RepID=A0AAD7UZG4_9FUNG|nr:uncharacterized protein O0I10_007902 [Lichtheimia ornata]KAJ8656337.1 hypothetical protein O0I10_007902 [Lichtheimia ornata]